MGKATEPTATSRVWRIAHRGARDEAPENTLTAFERALMYPIDGIELDIQMSADGVPIIYHDATLWRIARRRWRVAECTLTRLTQLDWGVWYHRDFKGEPLPTLERTLDRFGGRTRLMLEIKTVPADHTTGHTERMTRRVIELLARARPELSPEQIFILSFDDRVLRQAHGMAPQWQYVLNLPQRRPESIMTPDTAPIDHLSAICVAVGKLSEPLAAWRRRRGLKLFTYTCNNRRQVQKAMRTGVDAIMSDRPGWLIRQLDRGNGLSVSRG